MNKSAIVLMAGLVVAGAAGATAAVNSHGSGWGKGSWGFGGWGGHRRSGTSALKERDTDKDGVVTLEEFVAAQNARFASLDANKDQALDALELTSKLRERSAYGIKRFIKAADKNADGKISKEEFAAGPKERFSARDLDGDGKITDRDLPPRHKSRERSADKAGDSAKKHDGAGGEQPSLERTLANSAERFKTLDTNGDGVLDEAELAAANGPRLDYALTKAMHVADKDRDGKVTLAEYTDKTRARFSRLDLNGDGRITADDLPPSEREAWSKGTKSKE